MFVWNQCRANLLMFSWKFGNEHMEAWTKWLLFCRQHFQMRYLGWQLLHFDSYFTDLLDSWHSLLWCLYMYQSEWTQFQCELLTDLPMDKMAAISQTIYSDAFSWMKSLVFWLKFHWSLFQRVQLTIIQHWQGSKFHLSDHLRRVKMTAGFRWWLGAE